MYVDFEKQGADEELGDKVVITFETPDKHCISKREIGPNHTRYTIKLNWDDFAEAYENAVYGSFMIREALAMQRGEPPQH